MGLKVGVPIKSPNAALAHKRKERATRLARTRGSAGCNIESHTCNFNTVNASANARPLTRLRQPTFVSTPVEPRGTFAQGQD
jgi:hypothetical protein